MPSGGAVEEEEAVAMEEAVRVVGPVATEEPVRVVGPVTAGEGPAMAERGDGPKAE
jgi:hypothetical protein